MNLFRPVIAVAAAAASIGFPILVAAQEPNTRHIDRRAPASLWRDLETAYEKSNVKPTAREFEKLRITFLAAPVGKRIGSMAVEKAVNCGGTKKSPVAAAIPLSIRLVSEIVPADNGADIVTTLVADAIPAESGEAVPRCESTGEFEKRISGNLPGGTFVTTVITTQGSGRPPG